MAQFFGWRVAHFRAVESKRRGWVTPVAADGKGFPDTCMVRDRIIFREFKVGYNKLEPEQEAWRDAIIKAGGDWAEWRVEQWEDGTIEETLKWNR